MSRSINLFIEKLIPEALLLTRLNEVVSAGMESLNYRNEAAAGFLIHLEYDAGFRLSAMLCWAAETLAIDDIRLAQTLAASFSTRILLAPQHMNLPGGYDWCLVTEDQQLYAVAVTEQGDGLALRPDVPSVQLSS
jgi:hypothetical protein